MNDVGLGELLVRMVVSLLVVLGLVLGAYAIIRRRQGAPSVRSRRVTGGMAGPASKRSVFGGKHPVGGGKRGLRIVGRIGVGRTSNVVAVQFADRVFMLGTSEQGAPNVLAEIDLQTWTDATEAPEDVQPVTRSGLPGRPGGPGGSTGDRRPGLLDSLREATTRRG